MARTCYACCQYGHVGKHCLHLPPPEYHTGALLWAAHRLTTVSYISFVGFLISNEAAYDLESM